MDPGPIVPAILLTLGVLGVLVTDLLARGQRPGVPVAIALASLVAAAVAAAGTTASDALVLGVLRADAFGLGFTVFCCVVGVVTVLATMRGEALRTPGGEFLTLVLSAVLGMSVLSMSADLVSLYLAFETVSIPSYVLVGMRRADPKANEASLKYVLFGAVSSGAMIYGLSWIVGLCGTTSLDGLAAAIENGAAAQPAFPVACVLVFAGFAFKISAVPFHFWAPDVYAGAPASVGGFLAVASKAAGFAALVRVVGAVAPEVPALSDPLAGLLPDGGPLIGAIAVSAILTMTLGNLGALRQREIKRLLAWSSIAHAGYILLAMSVWSQEGTAALLLYLVAYLFMNLAAFLIAGIVIREVGTGEFAAWRGLGRTHVVLGLGMAIVLFSLTGLPPFFGFVAKLVVFYAVFEKGYVWLGVIGLVNGVISLAYYARVAAVLYLSDPEEADAGRTVRLGPADVGLLTVLVLPVLVFGIAFWGQIQTWARAIVPAVFGGG